MTREPFMVYFTITSKTFSKFYIQNYKAWENMNRLNQIKNALHYEIRLILFKMFNLEFITMKLAVIVT